MLASLTPGATATLSAPSPNPPDLLGAVAMLRAHVFPALPLVLLATGPVGVIGAIVSIESEGSAEFMAYPMVLMLVGYVWLGWHLFREPAIDASVRRQGLVATA